MPKTPALNHEEDGVQNNWVQMSKWNERGFITPQSHQAPGITGSKWGPDDTQQTMATAGVLDTFWDLCPLACIVHW